MIRVLIADDEPLARRYLRSLVDDEDDCEIVAECGDAAATIRAIEAERPDLVFLDVQMPGQDGFAVIRQIGSERMPHTVFVTAHNRYAIPAFETHALDYLLKPFSRERFQAALTRVRAQLTLQQDANWPRKLRNVLQDVLDSVPDVDRPAGVPQLEVRTGGQMERIPVKVGGRVVLLQAGDLEWIEAAGSYVNLHKGRDVYLLRETMNAMERSLDPGRFVRIHRSTIVNIDYVREIRTDRTGDHQIVLTDGSVHTLSRRRKKDVERLFGRPI